MLFKCTSCGTLPGTPGAHTPRSAAKRSSSSLKDCPLIKEVRKEARREGEEGMDMAGKFPACKSEMLFLQRMWNYVFTCEKLE